MKMKKSQNLARHACDCALPCPPSPVRRVVNFKLKTAII